MKIFALSGKIGSGKDYLIDKFIKETGIGKKLSFGKALKDEVKKEGRNDYEYRKAIKEYASTRELYFCNILKKQIEKENDIIFISDLRFLSQINMLNNFQTYYIRIDSSRNNKLINECDGDLDKIKECMSSISETQLDFFDFDFRINNSIDGFPVFKELILSLI